MHPAAVKPAAEDGGRGAGICLTVAPASSNPRPCASVIPKCWQDGVPQPAD